MTSPINTSGGGHIAKVTNLLSSLPLEQTARAPEQQPRRLSRLELLPVELRLRIYQFLNFPIKSREARMEAGEWSSHRAIEYPQGWLDPTNTAGHLAPVKRTSFLLKPDLLSGMDGLESTSLMRVNTLFAAELYPYLYAQLWTYNAYTADVIHPRFSLARSIRQLPGLELVDEVPLLELTGTPTDLASKIFASLITNWPRLFEIKLRMKANRPAPKDAIEAVTLLNDLWHTLRRLCEPQRFWIAVHWDHNKGWESVSQRLIEKSEMPPKIDKIEYSEKWAGARFCG